MSKEVNEKTLVQQVEKAEIVHEEIEVQQLTKAQDEYEKSGYTEERDIAIGLLHQAKTHNAYAKLATCASLADLIHVKENKLYRAVAGYSYISSNGEKVATMPTWDAYCEAMGLSRRTVDLQIQNSKVVGVEAYEAMVNIGIGSGAFRKLRQLPEDDITAVVNDVEINLGDKDAILDLIDDLSEKHIKDKEELKKYNENLNADLEASRQRVTEQAEEVTDLKAKLYHRDNFSAYPDLVNSIRYQCTEAAGEALIILDKFDQLKIKIQTSDLGEYNEDDGAIDPMIQSYWSMLWQVQARVADLLEDAHLTYGELIDRTITNRAYPDIGDSLRDEIQSAVDDQVDALKEYTDSSKAH